MLTNILAATRRNSGALIIGVALIVGLNFDRFVGYTKYAVYHLSGQAEADANVLLLIEAQNAQAAKEYEARLEQWRQETRARSDKEKQEAEDKQRRTRTLTAAWSKFLSGNQARFKEIKLVKDANQGDYFCIERKDPRQMSYMRKEKFETADYDIKDQVSDAFVAWLNKENILTKADWKYDDLHSMTVFLTGYHCLKPSEVWRANRYQ
jgi:hypothetical protein